MQRGLIQAQINNVAIGFSTKMWIFKFLVEKLDFLRLWVLLPHAS
jgi:hypothetical protein